MAHWMDLLGPETPTGAYLPWRLVEPRVGISRTTAWRLQKTGDFQKPYVISRGRVGYRECEIAAWTMSRAHRGETGKAAAEPPRSEDAARSPLPPSLADVTSEPDFALTSPGTAARHPRAGTPAPRLRLKPLSRDQMTFDF